VGHSADPVDGGGDHRPALGALRLITDDVARRGFRHKWASAVVRFCRRRV